MKRMTRIGVGVGAAVLTVSLAAGVFAAVQGPGGFGGPGRFGGPGGPGRMGGPGRGGPMAGGLPLAELGLTDAQQQQVRSTRESHQAEIKGLADRTMAAREALHAATTSGTFDEGLIRTRAAELAAVESDVAVAHARIYSEIFGILTPEQQAKAKEIQANRQERIQDWRRSR
jgi:Spy/CpxP family protein refolding chaperone